MTDEDESAAALTVVDVDVDWLRFSEEKRAGGMKSVILTGEGRVAADKKR